MNFPEIPGFPFLSYLSRWGRVRSLKFDQIYYVENPHVLANVHHFLRAEALNNIGDVIVPGTIGKLEGADGS